MDELELLKSKWQDGNQELPKLSYNDIYRMLHNKSASIVKWIFIISIFELVFWIILGLLSPESQQRIIGPDWSSKYLNYFLWYPLCCNCSFFSLILFKPKKYKNY